MRKAVTLLFVLCLACCAGLMTVYSGAESAGLCVAPVNETIRPGRAVLLSFDAPAAGDADLTIRNAEDEEISVVVLGLEAQAGTNSVWWNGTWNGKPAEEGSWRLVLEINGEKAETAVQIGSVAPYLSHVAASDTTVRPGAPVTITFYASCSGRITSGLRSDTAWQQLSAWQVSEGTNTFTWDGAGLGDGSVTMTLQLTDAAGEVSSEEQLSFTLEGCGSSDEAEDADGASTAPDGLLTLVEDEEEAAATAASAASSLLTEEEEEELILLPDDTNDQSQYTPSYGSPYAGQDTTMNYWTLPMDITDEEKVWEMLMQPITVLDAGTKNGEKTQVTIRKTPDSKGDGIGVVTCLTQSVHVLEKGDEWTLIECYSSSFHDSKVKAWNMLVQGYVPTKYLKTVTPYQGMGIVIDKLTQRMYIFKDGSLYDTLLVSTGLANAKQPYNETRSGEFLLQCPAVGEFRSDNLYCSMAIRFNKGDLLHEVPHTKLKDGTKNFKSTEYKLGTKASHGCIRVQRKTTPKGVNMRWVWDHRQDEMKIVIWEDWQGRQYAYPDDDTVLYYNPDGGSCYHTAATCSSTNKELVPFTYGELDSEPYAGLTRCDSCTAPLRKAEIDEINAKYAPGGVHDEILTAAQEQCMEKLGLIK